ncbi:hypothetical protein [Aquimarina muelleri]|uniref:Uncharacterized protein n=1 Tax=Aquimarina muelleri TaxID=279356 RepID=A0A918JWK3_9FLAO|nr:hypothetical protein [Aquimarina muelleri]MCX2761850.1 hypothetical protein [Aquimarina muelleri]GGX23697.1 hypothetical protein GCM10007384_26150 [Aquimarina muelleri]
MKKFSVIFSVIVLVVIFVSCEKNDIENETGIEFKAINKEDVTPPGGQGNTYDAFRNEIDKDRVESSGGQSGN